MKASEYCLTFIEGFEGCILGAYDDYDDKILKPGDTCRGTLTIGIGHTSAAGSPDVYIGMVITQDEAYTILANDLSVVEQQVTSLVKVPLNQNQFDALVSFQYNTGALGTSSALKLLNGGDYNDVASHLLLYDKDFAISQSPIPGLVKRRQAEANLFNTPITQTTGKTNDLFYSLANFLLGLWRSWILRRSSGSL